MDKMDETKKEKFLKRNKLAICATLRELHKNNTTLMVNHARGHFISNILDVQPDDNTFIFDLGGTMQESDVFDAELNFVAEPAGAKVEFKANVVSKIDYQGLPAFRAEIPADLYRIQRRSYFRINSPAWPPMICRGSLPDDSRFQFTIKDLSLGGVCLLSEQEDVAEQLEQGEILENVTLELGTYGEFSIDVQFISHAVSRIVCAKGEVKKVQRLSFKFPCLTPAQERSLQQVITALELEQHEKRKRVL
ncbi:flagellar brake protein [Lonsdalea populi]|nr:flagellar brake protein [Lonsdalea populi]RAT47166.1 flagellar brake protein [Lonsdalea populi]RAT47733.1 flagellar brake protein [Lonsdalea populi]RAT56744.1 flagellar brake protein [Lonsdalea populi]